MVPQNRSPTFADAIAAIFDHRLAEVHTCLPGRISKYDQATQLADVEVCVKRRTQTDEGEAIVESFPILPNVPVDVAQTSGFFTSFPIAVGDFVWVHFVEQSIDKWMSKGGIVDDELERRFNFKDCFATLARNPKSPIEETENDAMVMGGKGSAPRAYFTNSIIGLGAKAPSSFVALGDKVLTELTKLKTALQTATYVNAAGTPTTLVIAAPLSLVEPSATKVKAV